MITKCSKFINFFKQNIIPHINAFCTEALLVKKENEILQNEYNVNLEDKEDKVILDDIKDFYNKEIERKQRIESKAKAVLFIISLTISFALGSLNFIFDNKLTNNSWILLFLIIGIVYLILSAITCIKSLNIKGFYGWYLRDRFKETDSHVIEVTEYTNKDLIIYYYQIIKANQFKLNIKTNYIYSTYIGLRNGIIMISLFFIFILLGKLI
jgi:cytochrome c biogenesis protein CcdA